MFVIYLLIGFLKVCYFFLLLHLKWGAISVHSRATNLASNSDCSNSYGFRDIAFFMIFRFFPKNLDIKKTNGT